MTDLIRQRAKIPDVYDRNGKGNMPESFAAHGFSRDFDPATIADNAFVTNALILAAKAFPIAGRSEDLLAKKAVFLRAVRTVIDRFRFRHFAMTAGEDAIVARKRDRDLRKPFERRFHRKHVSHNTPFKLL